jgi:hypothetical protein
MVSIMRCPFCGHVPDWQEQTAGKSVMRQLACKTPDCRVEVRTRRAGTDEQVVADWNQRVSTLPTRHNLRMHIRKILTRAREANRKPSQ